MLILPSFYSILADEVTDCGTREQMPLVLSYAFTNRDIQESFISYTHCDNGIQAKL